MQPLCCCGAGCGSGGDILVGVLMRARGQQRVSFEGELLFRGVHDGVPITYGGGVMSARAACL